MCSIAGIVGDKLEDVRAAVSTMTAAQSHRGPDDSGTSVLAFGSQWLGLGHTRLSIIDLSSAGHQPMIHPRTGDCIIFNGEIYNFLTLRRELEAVGESFRGHSDTEVLLAALVRWGTSALTRLEGMYAFAFCEPGKGRLLLARDPLGIKPLYISRAGGRLVFASEVRAVLASGCVCTKIDPAAVAGLLAYGAVQHPLTLYRDVHSLPPGSWQEFQAGNAGLVASMPQRFWNYPAPRSQMSAAGAVKEVEAVLDAAVRDHLVADVPVGVFLSSGLDSTIIAGLAKHHTRDVHSFTVGFADEPDFNELHYAGETARLFGLQHTEVLMSGAEAESAAKDWLATIDLPSVDGLNVFVLARAVRNRGIKVALSGQGGDELFGGYPSFKDVPRLHRLLQLTRSLPVWARRQLAGVAALGKSQVFRAKLADMAASDDSLLSIYLHRRRLLSDKQLSALGLVAVNLGLTEDFMPPEAIEDVERVGLDAVRLVSEYESRFYQGNMLLRDADANGMAHGLEIRVPMLDQRLLNLVHALPGSVRLPTRHADKGLLRQAFGSLLRPELLRQAKRGFVLPIQRWMRTSLRLLCEENLNTLKDVGLFRPAGIEAIWQSFQREPETPLWTRAFILCVLGAFLRRTGAAA